MEITTKFKLGDKVGYNKRGPEFGYLFMEGTVTRITVEVEKGKQQAMYKIEFFDKTKHSGWRSEFTEEELEYLPIRGGRYA